MNELCYIIRTATLIHPDGRHKCYLFNYNKKTYIKNVIVDHGREYIENENRTLLSIRAVIMGALNAGYYIQDSQNLNEGKYTYDIFNLEELI